MRLWNSRKKSGIEIRDKRVSNLTMTFKAKDWVRLPREEMYSNERRENRTRLQWTEDYSIT